MASCSCLRCGSTKIEFKREDAGFRKTPSGSIREHRTVGICKDCGHTWVVAGPDFEKKPVPRAPLISFQNVPDLIIKYGGYFIKIIGALVIIMIVGIFIHGRINEMHQSTKKPDYEVTQSNISFVSNPSEQYVIDILKEIDGIMEVAPATEENDRNHLLSKENGATCVVFFSYNKIDQSSVSGDTLLEKGTGAGGCIEVFRNEVDAKRRDNYLGIFGISGSHVTIGSTVVRTSPELSYEDQDALESNICKALLRIEE